MQRAWHAEPYEILSSLSRALVRSYSERGMGGRKAAAGRGLCVSGQQKGISMKKYLISLMIAGLVFGVGILPASAHRSGCHRWHSCPSDTGSYVCGDLGYTSGCPTSIAPQPNPAPSPTPSTGNSINSNLNQTTDFIGKPRTRAQLYRCPVVGNYNSHIYHLKGSRYIRSMSVSKKMCFATEQEAIKAGFRKSKAR